MKPDPADPVYGRALEVIETLRGAGHQALIAGGAVRDLLLGRPPDDFDVTTSARPEEVQALFPQVVPVGLRFGVVLVIVDGQPVEVATFREDAVYEDGRHPVSVSFSETPEEDARRRDFTVNGLFLDPRDGSILDFVGGRADLERGVIRAIGHPPDRFHEDRLRMLRAVRFACALGFEIEEATYAAIHDLAPEIATVSGERIRDELFRMLTGPARGRSLGLLRETGLLAAFLPEVDAMWGVAQPEEFHPEGDVFTHTALLLDELRDPSAELALAGLLHDVGKPPTFTVTDRIRFNDHPRVGAEMSEGICRRLRLSGAQTGAVCELVRDHLRFMEVKRMREAKLRRFLMSPRAEEHLELHRADCLASHRKLGHYEFCRAKRDEWLAEPPPAPPLLTGRDLIGLGFRPGPLFAEILSEVRDLQIEGALASRDDALAFVKERFGGDGDDHA